MKETPDDIEDIVGMNCGKNKVPSQGRLNGDLGSLRVPDLSYHYLIRIMPQY